MKEYEYLEKILRSEYESADFLRSIWTDKHERLLSFADECLDYLWDIIPTERGAVIILMDKGLYEGKYDFITTERIRCNKEYVRANSIDELAEAIGYEW